MLELNGDKSDDLRAYVTVTNSDTDGAGDVAEIAIVGNFALGDVSATGWVKGKRSDGGNVWFLVSDVDPRG